MDFPDDFGPHTNVDKDGFLRLVDSKEASFLFHAGGETRSWSIHFLGASSEVHILDKYVS